MLAELRTFIAIARFGTFSLAGERTGLTQAAVSGQIKRLEDQLGFALFDRTGRSATINADGARTLQRALTVVALVDALGDPDTDAATGTLRIGAISSLQTSMLARAMVRFRQHYPGMKVQVVPGLSVNLVDRVDAGELDMAILIRPPFAMPPELSWQRLAMEDYALIVPSTVKSDDWQDILQTQLFMRYDHLSLGGREVDRFIRGLPFTINDMMEVPVQSMVPMVQNGLGVALIPLSEAHLPLPAGVRIVPLSGQMLQREIGLVRAMKDHSAPATRYMAECLADAVKPKLGGNRDIIS